MRKQAHTPGPWRVDGYEIRADFIMTDDTSRSNGRIAITQDYGQEEHSCPPYSQCRANARLIAEAPAMADAWRSMLLGDLQAEREALKEARAILARIDAE